MTNEVSRSNAQHQAVTTRHAAGPSTRLLSRPDSPHLAEIPPDDRFGPAGKVLHVYGYDANQPPPLLPARGDLEALQGTGIEDLCGHLVAHVINSNAAARRPSIPGARRVLELLLKFPGDSWDQRWLASGFDRAPRSWLGHAADTPARVKVIKQGVNVLIQARVLLPSYSWLLESRFVSLGHFLNFAGGPALAQLREVPA